MAIYQARFLKYLDCRGLADTKPRKVWAFMGDGEMDEPESLGAISLGGREHLDNLVFVINCNLQRLDGPVRGNGKIVQELEADFRGAGWNVIKVLWGSAGINCWPPTRRAFSESAWKSASTVSTRTTNRKNGAYVREHFFGKYPELKSMVAHMSDDEIWGTDPRRSRSQKVYAAYKAASEHKGQPTVILAKTVKGYGGQSGEGQMSRIKPRR